MSGLEGRGSAEGSGFFEKGLMAALESSRHARGVYREVKVVANGHSHCTSVLHITIYHRFKPHLCPSDRELSTCQGRLDVFRWWRVGVLFHGIEPVES